MENGMTHARRVAPSARRALNVPEAGRFAAVTKIIVRGAVVQACPCGCHRGACVDCPEGGP